MTKGPCRGCGVASNFNKVDRLRFGRMRRDDKRRTSLVSSLRTGVREGGTKDWLRRRRDTRWGGGGRYHTTHGTRGLDTLIV